MNQPDSSSIGAGFRSARLFVVAWLSLILFRFTLSLFGYRLSKRLLRDDVEKLQPAPPAFARRAALAANRASRYAPGATCLVRAMAGKFLFDRKSFASSICVGVAKEINEPLKAHAWLKSGDLVVIGDEERQLGRYAPLMRSS